MSNHTQNSQQVETIEDSDIEEVLDKVESFPDEKKQTFFQQLEIYQGDLPHPNILKGYSELYPKAAERIIENGIAETEHRRKMEKEFLRSQTNYRIRGQVFGFIVALVIILGGIYLIKEGHVISGSAMTGLSAIGIIGLFTGKNNNQDSDDEKDK